MFKQAVLISRIYDFENHCYTIGGIQTYIRELANLLKKLGVTVIVAQLFMSYKRHDSIEIDGIKIIRIPAKRKLFIHPRQNAFNEVFKTYNTPETLFIIGTDQIDIKTPATNVITIQHGIAFDTPGNMLNGLWKKNTILQRICKLLKCISNTNRFYHTKNLVCVDYNYYNWLRTLGTISNSNNCKVIINHTNNHISKEELEQKIQSNKTKLKIIFARRFETYRGALIFANAIKQLFSDGYSIDVTFAGRGPLSEFITNLFKRNPNVHITKYNASKSVAFHSQFDIAVIPTIYSEGTSLSLCEAMAAGCIPIASHVGGLTNIILDGFNGFLCAPNENDLYMKLKYVIELPIETKRNVIRNAYNTAISTLSTDNWEHNWTDFINQVYNLHCEKQNQIIRN